jgi:uncharacterized damage-inducible protein DinB
MYETTRIADQLHRAFTGDAWHGDSLLEILNGVTAAQAAARPIPHAHSIWELVLHIAAWDGAVLRRLGGVALELSDAENFPSMPDMSDTAWRKTLGELKQVHHGIGKRGCGAPRYTSLRVGSGQTRSALHVLLHAPRCSAARALSCGTDCTFEEVLRHAASRRPPLPLKRQTCDNSALFLPSGALV